MKRQNYLTGLITILLLTSLIISCTSKEEEKEAEKGFSPITVTAPRSTGMNSVIQLNANTMFLKKEAVRSPFAGYIQKELKNVGDNVSEGDALFLVQTKEANAIGSGDKGAIPIKAKSNGVVTQVNFHTGDYIAEGEQLASVSNPASLAIVLNVPYQNLKDIKIGAGCTLCLPDGKNIQGKISKSLPSMDAASQTQSFLIDTANPGKLPENLNLTVLVSASYISGAIAVPRKSVLSNETLDEFWVMRLLNDSTAVKIGVKKGIENDSLIQIVSPKLSISDKIVLDGGYGLADTAKVIIKR